MTKPSEKAAKQFVICRCGEAFESSVRHVCMPKEQRAKDFPTLRSRWSDPKVRAEIMRALHETGVDPAIAPGSRKPEQREFLND